MAALVVFAELRYRDGKKEKISVNVENGLSSLITGIKELNANVSQLLSGLVEQEKAQTDSAEGEEEKEDSDEEDDEPDGLQNSQRQPPAKRSKT